MYKMTKVKHIKYAIGGKEEYVTIKKYDQLNKDNVEISLVKNMEL